MKKIFTLLLFFALFIWFNESYTRAQSSSKLVEFCSTSAGDDATYLKDFVVELAEAGPDGRPPTERHTMVLSKNTEYRFTVCNADGSEGKAMIQLFDMNKLYGSTYNPATGQSVKSFNIQIQKTGAYQLVVSFIDGKKGSSVVIVSFIRTL